MNQHSVLSALAGLTLACSAAANTHPPVSDALQGSFLELGDTSSFQNDPSSAVQRDLLSRLRSSFSLTISDDPAVQQELAWFARHPEYLDRVFGRGDRYLYFIMGELEKREMPAELALLPIVESAFDPFAYSHGRAAGLWQIIPGTGKRFGLQQNWWYDGRRDVVEATRAALDYLELLVKRFDGDWLLAVAAYNSGEGNVSKAIRRNKAANTPIDFWHLRTRLPKETRAYVPRFLALAKIVGNPDQFNVQLPDLIDEPKFAAVDIGSQLDLALAAELAGVSMETLYHFNPAFNRWATAPKGPHRLIIPIDAAQRLGKALQTLPKNERMRWRRHKVAPGETISEIAEKYSTSLASIRSANNLKGNLIREGKHLLVPASTKPLSAYSQSADARLARTQNKQRGGEKRQHVVRSGESFWTISRQYGVSVRQLARWNAMAPGDTLSVGQTLVVWNQSGTQAVVTPAAASELASQSRTRRLRYTVRNGDNLSTIAARFRVGVSQLLRWNKLKAESILRPGQRLTLYVDVTRQSS